MSDTLPTLEELEREADEHLARLHSGNPLVQDFVRAHPDYVRRNWYAHPSAEAIECEEETLP